MTLKILAERELQEGGALYQRFVDAYEDYWQTIEPVMSWDIEKRKREGLQFLRTEGFDRRTAMLELAAQLASWNDDQLTREEAEISQQFISLKESLESGMVLFLGTGIALAYFFTAASLRLKGRPEKDFCWPKMPAKLPASFPRDSWPCRRKSASRSQESCMTELRKTCRP